MQQPPVPFTLEEYLLGEWLKVVEEEEDEEVLYSCRTIIVEIDFQERSVEIQQDNRTKSNMIISTYNIAENRARLMA